MEDIQDTCALTKAAGGTCEQCGGAGGRWFDSRWLCDPCVQIAIAKLTAEAYPSEADRRSGIGGTDIAAILGFDSRRDAFSLWAEKTGALSRSPATPRMRLGKYFERGIVAYYSEMTGRATEFRDRLERHPVRRWMLYSPDAVCLNEPRGVEAKLISREWSHQWGLDVDEIPPRTQLQARWYMAATDYALWDIAALVGDDLRIITVERDRELEDVIIEVAQDFWTKHVLTGIPPAMGASDESTRYLKERFPRMKTELRRATPEEVRLMVDYARTWKIRKAAELEVTRLENELKLAVGDAEGLETDGARFTWKNIKDSTKTDWEALAASLMGPMGKDERATLITEFSKTVQGIRRIHFAAKGLQET